MCGIIGYLGRENAVPILLEGLKKLEYRGYDSAGIATLKKMKMHVVKSKGKLPLLEERVNSKALNGEIGIGHTRWATHGSPSEQNAHPHTNCEGNLAVVHNGIIENYQQLKTQLLADGHRFTSETDTEVIAHLVESYYDGDLLQAVSRAVKDLEGSYALVVLVENEPQKLVAARKDSPLAVGLGEKGNFVTSDLSAILNYTRKALILENGELAVLSPEEVVVYNLEGERVEKEIFHVPWNLDDAEKEGFPHFMLKEIHEQPHVLRETFVGRLDQEGKVKLEEIRLSPEKIKELTKIIITACGTAYHAGLVGKYAIEKLARIQVEVDIASEFHCRETLLDHRTLSVVISQSGETADTLAALRAVRERGARVLAITNVMESSVSREAVDVLYTRAGTEMAIPSTKAYVAQLASIYLLAVYLGLVRGTLSKEEAQKIILALKAVPQAAEKIIRMSSTVKEWAESISGWEDVFFVGRGLDYAVALEGALKLKETSYVHAEACAAGELKHGTMALIKKGVPVVAIATQPELYGKMISNIKEIKARGANITAITLEGNEIIAQEVDRTIYLPAVFPVIATIPAVIPLQLFAYYTAVARECDVDRPRNLTKSIMVE